MAWYTDQSPEPCVYGAGPAASVAARLRAEGWAPEDRERGLNGRAATSAEPLETSQTSNISHLEHEKLKHKKCFGNRCWVIDYR